MGTWIDPRTRENPEGAMVHQPMKLELTLGGVLRPVPDEEKIAFLKAVADYDARQKQMAQQFPGAWPWPLSSMLTASSETPKPEAQHFDTEAHRAFMRGLG